MSRPEPYLKCVCQNCGGHIEFPSSGSGQTVPCPHCGWATVLIDKARADSAVIGGGPAARRNIFRAFLSAAIVVVVLGAAAVVLWQKRARQSPPAANPASVTAPASGPPVAPVVVKPVPPPDPWHGLMAGPVTLEKGEGRLVYAVGILTNKSDHERYGVQVELEVYNSAREKVGSTKDYKDSIMPGKHWKFKAIVTDQTATSAKLTSVKEN